MAPKTGGRSMRPVGTQSKKLGLRKYDVVASAKASVMTARYETP